jgi:hypothetical protein
VSSSLELARSEWEESWRRLETLTASPVARDRLRTQLEVVRDELRRRIGQTYTLRELADAARDADRWVREVVEERAPAPGWPEHLSIVEGAAFHLYSRGASDYMP